MLKVLALFALFLLVFGVQTHTQPKEAQQTSKSDNPSAPIAPLMPVAIQQKDGSGLKTEHQEDVDAEVRIISTPAKDRWDKASVLVNVALGLIGLGGIAVALVTLRKVERQTKAAELAAVATQRTVQAMIDSERPWIVAHMKQSKAECLLQNGNVRFEWTAHHLTECA